MCCNCSIGLWGGLEGDEIYCEVGTYLGSTLIGALWNHPQVTGWAVDNFAEYNPGGHNFGQLIQHLEHFDLGDQVCFFDQDFEAFFADFRTLSEPPPIGVYFYDGAHDYRSTLMGLLLATPFLADEALIILDDYNWESVQQAAWDFLSLYPQGRSLLEVHTPIARYPSFWNGIQVIGWKRHNPQPHSFEQIQAKRQTSLIQDLYNLQMREQEGERLKGLYYEAIHWHQQGEVPKARSCYESYLEQRPEDGAGWMNLGNLYWSQEEGELAQSCLEKALTLGQEHPSLYLNLGNCGVMLGDLDGAIVYYQRGLERFPEFTDLRENLEQVKAIQGNPAEFYRLQGDRYQQSQRYDRAYPAYQLALNHGDTSEHLYTQMILCVVSGEVSGDPLPLLHQAVTAYPKNEFFAFHWITELIRINAPEALTQAQVVADRQPESFTLQLFAHLSTPLLYHSVEEIEQHNQRYRRGIQHLLTQLDLRQPDSLASAVAGVTRFNIFYLTYQARNLRDEQSSYGTLVHRIMGTRYPQWNQPLKMPPVTEKIRVGYASSYLHSYSGTFWLTGWLKYADRSQFEIYCYYTGDRPDAITQFFQDHSDYFHHYPDDLEGVATQIRADNLHILVYPEIGMHGLTITQAALRLAPVQCTAWGHPLTSGLPTIDYYLSSELMEPENGQDHYRETLVRLPRLAICYRQPNIPNPLPKTRPDFGLTEQDVVYLCCQAPFKYLPQYDHLLVAIAQAVPRSKFVFIRADVLKPRLSQAFAQAGLDLADYGIFLATLPRPDYLALNCLADVYLDTIGFTGGNTTLDALACGLPVVTYPTEVMRGRMAAAMLLGLGLPDTIAPTLEDYKAIAIYLGHNPQQREALRQQIRDGCGQIFEDRSGLTALEQFYGNVARGMGEP